MIRVVNPDLQALKEEMQTMRKLKTTTSSAIEKRYKDNSYSRDKALKHNALLQQMYSTTSTFPVKVGGVIINYKLFQAFLRKLKGFEMRINITESSLALTYWKRGESAKGILSLDNLSEYFEGFKHIPLAELQRDAQTS